MEFNVKLQYPRSEEFEYETLMKRINLDEERYKDVSSGEGFIVSSPKAIKDDIKDPDGIYSTRFGQSLEDVNPFANRYRCKCGHLNQRIYNGIECEICHTKVEYVDDDFKYFGWIVLNDPYVVIHPNLFKSLSFLIGSEKLMNILEPDGKVDQDGNPIDLKPTKDEPFRGIGMLEFRERFDEIINFYALKSLNKKQYYDDIIENRYNVFTQSIPVYTTLLRPYRIEGGTFHFEDSNATYNIMARIAATINNDKIKIFRKDKPKNQLLFDLQMKFMELYESILAVLSGKKGSVRTLFGGRYNFSARSVIVPNPKLGPDEVRLGYTCLCNLLQQVIINILHKSYNMTYEEAYKTLFYESMTGINPRIKSIIDGLIKDSGRGIPILINRNPTISYGGILQMYCIGCTDSFTMQMPLQVLSGLGADFDGDTLNILYIINKDFLNAAERVLNPRNAMYISMNDGMFNNDYNHQRDTLINANTLVQLSRDNYSLDQIKRINDLKNADSVS